jgi:subtilisin-like proprotein convertase family protein
MSVLPPPVITSHTDLIPNNPFFAGTHNTPSVAVDPTNSNNVVAMFTTVAATTNPLWEPPGDDQTTFIQGAISTNAGQTWNPFRMGSYEFTLTDPTEMPSPGDPDNPLEQATDPNVAFDRNGNFYVVWVEHRPDNAAGDVRYAKFQFNGSAPVPLATPNYPNGALYYWAAASPTQADVAMNPTIAIDTNVPFFTDPTTGQTQTDPFSGNVYIGWDTNNIQPGPPPTSPIAFNPNTVKVIASSDGGQSFSTQIYGNTGDRPGDTSHDPNYTTLINAAGGGAQRDGAPRLVVSQGTNSGRTSGTFNGQVVGPVPGGELSVVWPDFGRDDIRSNSVTGAVSAYAPSGNINQSIVNAFLPQGSSVAVTTPTLSSQTVNITDPRFSTLTDVSVTLNIIHPNLNLLNVTLLPEAKLDKPYGITFSPDGRDLFVSSFNNNTVVEYDATTGSFVTIFVSAKSGGLVGPTGLAFGPNGDLFVLSTKDPSTGMPSNEVLEYDGTTGAFVKIFVAAGSAGLSDPEDMVFKGGVLYITSHNSNQVLKYDATTGAPIGTGVFVAMSSGGLSGPEGLVFGPDGNLYVSSLNNSSVLEYQGVNGPAPGAFIKTYVPSGFGGLASPEGLTFGADGELYVTSGANNQVLRYTGPNPGPSISAAVQTTAATPTTTSFVGPLSLSATDNFYNGLSLTFTSGVNSGLARQITSYTGATRTFTFATAWPSAPAVGDNFTINSTPMASGSVQGPTTSFSGPASLSSTDNFYNGFTLTFTSGANFGLSRQISIYSGATRTFNFANAWPNSAAPGDSFSLNATNPGAFLDDFVRAVPGGTGLGGLLSPQGIAFGPGPVVGGNNFLFVVSKTTNSVMRYSAVPGDPQPSIITSDNVQANPAPTTTRLAGSAFLNPNDNFYNGLTLTFNSGANLGLSRTITSYTGSNRLFTFATAWPVAPAVGDSFSIVRTGADFVSPGDGGLSNPNDLLLNNGLLLVSSVNTSSVLSYSLFDGSFQGTFIGTGSGGLQTPAGLAVRPMTNFMFVGSQANAQVLRYDATTGTSLGVFVPGGSGGLINPTDIAFGAGPDLYVTDSVANEVFRYDGATGAPKPAPMQTGAVFATGTGTPNGLTAPRALVFSPDNSHLFVTSYNSMTGLSQILEFDASTGAFISVFASSVGVGATPATPLNNPQGMFVYTDANGIQNLYVTNSNNQILRYNLATGKFMETIVPVNGNAGNLGGWSGAAGILVNPFDGMLYVSSTNNNSVMRYAGTPAMSNPSGNGPSGSAYFTAPGGGAAAPIILLDNHTDNAGNTHAAGATGQNLGFFNMTGVAVGTTFDDFVPRNISDITAAAPFAEQFQSEYGGLKGLTGQTAAQLNGTWTLEVTDERPVTQPMSILNWALTFTSGMGFGPIYSTASNPINQTDKLVAGPPPPGGIQPAPLIGRANSVGSTIPSINFTPVNPYPNEPNTPVSPDRGIGPAPVIASDNTLGSFSPYQGRLYIAYVARIPPPPANPLDNTDIFLSYSDDGGISWSRAPLKVNDDSAFDGFSEGTRPQFEPNIAVDQSTGTLVLTFYDARYDSARDRVTTTIATSIDGGQTFAPQTYLNDSRTARDAITGQLQVLEPIPDNQGAGYGGRDTAFGFGERQALAVSNGQVYSIWSGNENAAGLDIWTAKATIAAGPRILSGTEGPVSGQKLFSTFVSDGTQLADRFEVLFDRPVDPATFTTAMVQVMFRNTTTPAGSAPIPLDVTGVIPEDLGIFGPAQATGATQFLVRFDPAKALSLGGTYTGTYSYTVGSNISGTINANVQSAPPPSTTSLAGSAFLNPNDNYYTNLVLTFTSTSPGTNANLGKSRVIATYTGATRLFTFTNAWQIAPAAGDAFIITSTPMDRIRSFNITVGPGSPLPSQTVNPNSRVPPQDTGGDGPPGFPFNPSFDPRDTTFSSITTSAPGQFVTNVTVTVNIQHTSDSDLLIDLIGPDGTIVVLSKNEPKPDITAGSDQGFINTTFDDSASLPISAGTDASNFFGAHPFNNGTFRPETPLGQFLGKIADGVWTLAVDDTAQQDIGTLVSWTLNVSAASGTITLGTGNMMDQNSNGVRGENPGDLFIAPRPLQGVPFQLPYDTTTLPIIVPGPHIISTFVPGEPTTVDRSGSPTPNVENLVLNGTVNSIDIVFDRNMSPATVTPASILRIIGPVGVIQGPFTISADPNPNHLRFINGALTSAADPDPSHPRTYKITFPTQQLSGSYTVVLAPIMHAVPQGNQTVGDLLDTNLNAGLAVLRGVDPFNATLTAVSHTYSGPAVNLNPGKTTAIPLNFGPENFIIQGATLTLNITYPNDPDLEASLIAPDGTPIILFTRVGGGPGTNHANFTNTTFDDNANTPIQSGTPPFNSNLAGAFNPQTPLSVLIGKNSAGVYTLLIKNDASTVSGTHTLNNWTLNLLERVPGTGLGEQVADQATASFRIFTQNPANVLSHTIWTAVGPASENSSFGTDPTFFTPTASLTPFTGAIGPEGGSSTAGNSGRVGGMAVDPSDPSGNTVYIAGASGGVWKTTNFLTTDPNGPTYVPLTDFGPSFAINIGGLDVFGRNNDPKQSIIFAGTGEGDTGSKGVGIIRSMDGGATWTLLDSTNNVDASNVPLTYNSPSRDHIFIGNSTFKVVVDPAHAPTGPNDVIVYVAMSGPNGGLWRSLDSGNHWQRMSSPSSQGTTATDVLLAPASASVSSGNLQRVYAAFEGSGVYMSLSQGTNFTLMTGGVGNALIRDGDFSPATSIPVANAGVNPNGAFGRIVLAMPALTGKPNQDLLYSGWLYAVVANPDGTMHGLYVTKDAGANWTQIHLPVRIIQVSGTFVPEAIPSNDETNPDHNPLGTQGNYDVTLAVDPNNPSIVYVGGTEDFVGQPAGGLLRVDTTGLFDPHALTAFDNDDAGTGPLRTATTGSVNLKDATKAFGVLEPPGENGLQPWLNLISDPFTPFLVNSTVLVTNVSQFNNQGSEVRFMHFDGVQGTTDQHRVIAMKDPLTGRTRLIFGDDQGVYSVVDNGDGQFVNDIGGVPDPSTGILRGKAPVVAGSRNGNLQIIQFYYGAVQPSVLAAEVAAAIQGEGGMFYGNAQDDGFPVSDPHTLANGDIRWVGPLGDGTGIATDQTGTGTAYSYQWPCCGFFSTLATTDFFLVNDKGSGYISRTGTGGTSLVQHNNPGIVPDPQWPFLAAPVGHGTTDVVQSNFAVNPINGNQIVIGSQAGRIFRSRDQGRTWGVIADPSAGVLDGTMAPALAYGAPDPANPSQNLDDFVYIGTAGGNVYTTLDGGGTNGTDWVNLTAAGGFSDGSAVMYISGNPTRGSHEAYVVTNNNVWHVTFSVTYPTNAPPAVTNITWQKITGDIHNITTTFSNPANGLSFQLTHDSTKPSIQEEKPLQYLTALAVDWRFQNPNTTGGGVHPTLYVGGEGGVYRSLNVDNVSGVHWTVFPNVANDGSLIDGGYLPMAHVTDLHISAGNINPTTGKPFQSTGPNILVATTYGRGTFAIRLVNNSFNPVSGPIVASLLPTQPVGTSVSSVVVTFQTRDAAGNFLAVDPNSFTVNSIPSFVGPNGTITPSDVVDITPTPPPGQLNPHNVYEVDFPTQTVKGTYTMVIGPNVTDYAGNLMNQDSVGNPLETDPNGSADDSFTGRFYINTTPTGPFVSGIVGHDLSSGLLELAISNGVNGFTNASFSSLAPGITWANVHTGDFNGDGKTDIAARNLQTGQWFVGISTGSIYSFSVWGSWDPTLTWGQVLFGNFDGSGKTSIAGRAQQTGAWYVSVPVGNSFNTTVWGGWYAGVTWVDVNMGDFNGDGKTDIVGRVSQSGDWWVAQSTGTSFVNSNWAHWYAGATWVDVNVGNFAGDVNSTTGKPISDIVGRVLETGDWWTGVSSGSSFTTSLWGHWYAGVTWVNVLVGDFNGDGKTDIAGRISGNGDWWVSQSSGSSFTNSLWGHWYNGFNWATAIVGDFNGDGMFDIAGLDPANNWWVSRSTGSNFATSFWDSWPAGNWSDVQLVNNV